MFHTDKGGEYIGDLFAQACAGAGGRPSRWAGSARRWTTPPRRASNSTLEHELLSRRHFATKDQARREVARFIDAYNHRRRHSSCEMLPPVAYEQVLAERAAEAARTGPGRVKPASQIASDGLGADPMASRCRRMRGSISYQQPSTVSGEAHSSTRGSSTNPATAS